MAGVLHGSARTTTTRLAALDTLPGTVFGGCSPASSQPGVHRLLDQVEDAAPAGRVAHAIMDDAAHKHPEVLTGPADPRWMVHFTPTSCSWLDAVEGFFRLTR